MSSQNEIYIIVASESKSLSVDTINLIFPSAIKTNNEEFSFDYRKYMIKIYMNFPGKVSEKSLQPSDFLDILLSSCQVTSSSFDEIKNYIQGRKDTSIKIHICNDSNEAKEYSEKLDDSIKILNSKEVYTYLDEHINSLTVFNNQFNSFEDEKGKITDQLKISYLLSAIGIEDEKNLKRLLKDNKVMDYPLARRLFNSKIKYLKSFSPLNRLNNEVLKLSQTVIDCLNEYVVSQINTNKVNMLSSEIGSTKNPNGIGFKIDFLFGSKSLKGEEEKFPLVIRDNLITLSIEIKAKSTDNISQSLLSIEELILNLKKILSELTPDYYNKMLLPGFHLSTRRDEAKRCVYLDITVGGYIGDIINNKIKSLNLDILNFGLEAMIEMRNCLNLNDSLSENIESDDLVNNFFSGKITKKGEILNIKSIVKLLSIIANLYPINNKLKYILILLKLLLPFENNNINLEYNHKILLDIVKSIFNLDIYEIVNNYLQNKEMFLNMLIEYKDMITIAGEGVKFIDFENLMLSIYMPSIRLELNTFIYLVGLNSALEKYLF